MPTKVLCPWIMCNHNSKHKQVGEVGECQHKGEIELIMLLNSFYEYADFTLQKYDERSLKCMLTYLTIGRSA